MRSAGRIAVWILVLGLAATSYCAQACSIPQAAAPECPQHHQSEKPNGCENSSIRSLGIKSTALFSLPGQSASASEILNHRQAVQQKYGPPDIVLSYSVRLAPSVLRV